MRQGTDQTCERGYSQYLFMISHFCKALHDFIFSKWFLEKKRFKLPLCNKLKVLFCSYSNWCSYGVVLYIRLHVNTVSDSLFLSFVLQWSWMGADMCRASCEGLTPLWTWWWMTLWRWVLEDSRTASAWWSVPWLALFSIFHTVTKAHVITLCLPCGALRLHVAF